MLFSDKEFYQCPDCGEQITWADSQVVCTRCYSTFPILDGIPYFLKEQRYWCNLPSEKVNEINECIREHGWESALETIIPPYLRSYVVGTGRDDARFFLPIDRNAIVLDLGSMWGALSFGLAQHCQHVFAFDQTLETLRMLDLRRAATHTSNISVSGGDALRLPFKSGIFDVVIINGVLEWVGLQEEYVVEQHWGHRKKSGQTKNVRVSPRDLQLLALKQALRVLKPGGVAYIAIENRYSYLYLLLPDDHSGLRYTSLMPRKLANLYMRLRVNQDYRTYTYGVGELQKLVRDAGFARMEMYTAFPGYTQPDFVFPLDERLLRYYSERFSRAFRQKLFRTLCSHGMPAKIAASASRLAVGLYRLSKLGVKAEFVPCFLLLATKGKSC